MKRRSPDEVFHNLVLNKVIPVASIAEPRIALRFAETALQSNLNVLEFTFRVKGAAGVISAVKEHIPEMMICAGTVLTLGDARAAWQAGAELIVSPGFNREIVSACLAEGVAVLPGVATPTEVEYGLAVGLNYLKLFPAGVIGGVKMLQALHGPYPGMAFVPTGGIGPGNLLEYLAQPNVAACAGTWMAPKSRIESQDWEGIGELMREAALHAR